MSYDKRALKILFDTYWGPRGWKWGLDRGPATLADFEYAVQAGTMFHPGKFSHDESLKQIAVLRSEISPRQVGEGFVASLSGATLAQRSALGSYAVALNMPAHTISPAPGSTQCTVCSAYQSDLEQDFSVLNFERHKWGGVRHENPLYIAFDLGRFKAEGNSSPSSNDQKTMDAILAAIQELGAGRKRVDLLKAVRPHVPGNDQVRVVFLAILGFAGILRIPGRGDFFRSFTPTAERTQTPWHTDDWKYPIRWWAGGNGIDWDAVDFWFGKS